MKIFYVLDSNGTMKSSDGTKTYKCLKGKALKDFLSSDEGKKRYFYISKDDKDNSIGIEVSGEQYRRLKKDIDRTIYLKIMREELDVSETSIENLLLNDGYGNGEEILVDESQDVERVLMKKEEKALLNKALRTLKSNDRRIVFYLFLSDKKMTGTDLARMMNVSPQYVNSRKRHILRWLRSLFNIWLQD